MKVTDDSGISMAIVPTSGGFGYIAFESPGLPMEWGVKQVMNSGSRDFLLKVGVLVHMVQPSLLILEDANDASSRRSKRVRQLMDRLAEEAKKRGIEVARYSRAELLAEFGKRGGRSKDDIAAVVAELVPELAPRLPPRRRIWESQHHSMAIFEAAALALTHFAIGSAEGLPPGVPPVLQGGASATTQGGMNAEGRVDEEAGRGCGPLG
jgi:hypothetical protein